MSPVRRPPRSNVRGPRSKVQGPRSARNRSMGQPLGPGTSDLGPVIRQLTHIERTTGDGELELDDGRTLHVSSLDKVYFPRDEITKGALMRYYAQVAPVLLPILADRPLGL